MTKKWTSLILALVMCMVLCVPAFAAAPAEDVSSGSSEFSDQAQVPRLGPATKTIYITASAWTDLVTDNNILDERFTVEMPLANPGGCLFRIRATDNKNVTTTIENSGNVNNGSSWISQQISWIYKSYTVQVKAITTASSYTFTYYD